MAISSLAKVAIVATGCIVTGLVVRKGAKAIKEKQATARTQEQLKEELRKKHISDVRARADANIDGMFDSILRQIAETDELYVSVMAKEIKGERIS